ncbi:MAG: phosphoribosylanthranilate isomerase [Candidatus Hinthialibacter antarcticus]|nr:phosphoribosylanthranilate isomerase [Candidatus Hinthialibacter antarcticus]
MSCKIKICGLTNLDDINLIAQAGADYGGLLVNIDSPRGVTLEDAQRLSADMPLPLVAVTMNEEAAYILRVAELLKPTALQLHGAESPETVSLLKQETRAEIWKVIHLPACDDGTAPELDQILKKIAPYQEAGADRILIDAKAVVAGVAQMGGTGKTVDWNAARVLRKALALPLVLAGGVKPGNAAEAVSSVKPYAIDVSSGVEQEKGKKDPAKVHALIEAVRGAE